MVSRALGRHHPPRPSAAALRPRETVVCFPQFLCDELSERVCADPLWTTLSPRQSCAGCSFPAAQTGWMCCCSCSCSAGAFRGLHSAAKPVRTLSPATCPPAPASSAAAGGSCCRGSFQSASWRPAACRWVFWWPRADETPRLGLMRASVSSFPFNLFGSCKARIRFPSIRVGLVN